MVLAAAASAQTNQPTRDFDAAEIAKLNAWTVGLAAGQVEGAPLRFATDISRVVDDGNNLHVLPIVTRGPTENVEALLYLGACRTIKRTFSGICAGYSLIGTN
jgi:hypothetical protein